MSEAALPAAIGFCENAVRLRAAHYREEAERFRSLAGREPLAQMRRHLMQLAAQYDKLASDLELPGKEAGMARQ
jgi:fumarate hydratase class II